MSQCIHCVVSGRVQGVFFRVSTEEMANRLGLSGWVRNTPSGNVEVEACGSAKQLGEFHEWLWKGPVGASVKDVRCKEAEGIPEEVGFYIKY